MASKMRRIAIIIVLVFCAHLLFAQGDKVQTFARLSAATDTIALGRPFTVSLMMRYPGVRSPLLPDSTRGYGKFVLEGLHYPPGARTEKDGWVTDSVVLTLRAFDVADTQTLRAQVGFVRDKDTLRLATNTLRFRFRARIQQYNDALQLKKNFDLAHVEPTPNYLLWFVIAFIIIASCVIGFFLLQKPVRRWLHRRRLQRQYEGLLEKLLQAQQLLPAQPLQFINQLNGVWKDYLDADWRAQLRTQTAREVDAVLRQKMAEADGRITLQQLCQLEEQVNYARRPLPMAEVEALLQALRTTLAQEYERRKEAAS